MILRLQCTRYKFHSLIILKSKRIRYRSYAYYFVLHLHQKISVTFQIIYETSVAPKGLDFIFKVKNRIEKNSPALSLEDLLKPHLVEADCLEKISFELKLFNNLPIEQLKNYLIDSNSHKCAVCFLENQTEIGHAVNMYDFVYGRGEEYFCYKDSSFENYYNCGQSPTQGWELHRNDFNRIIDAWTFTAKYNEDA